MDVFTALADPTRRHIIELLASRGELSASDIYDKFPVSPPAISQHLKVLRDTNLVTVEKQAQKRVYHINKETFSEFEQWINKMRQFWNEKFDALEQLLEKEKKLQKINK